MKKVQFGCGGNRLSGWENHDSDVDITKPLPYENDSVDFIFCEHLLEHVDHCQGLHFLDECFRILKKGGVIRITVPKASRILTLCVDGDEYCKYTHAKGFSRSDKVKDAARALIENHGHKSIYTQLIIGTLLAVAGFISVWDAENTTSEIEDLSGINGHFRECGMDIFQAESITVEAQK